MNTTPQDDADSTEPVTPFEMGRRLANEPISNKTRTEIEMLMREFEAESQRARDKRRKEYDAEHGRPQQ